MRDYRRNMSGNFKKVFMFIRLSILLVLSRPFESRNKNKNKNKTKQNKYDETNCHIPF